MLQNSAPNTYIYVIILLSVPTLGWSGDVYKLNRLSYFESKLEKQEIQQSTLDWRQPIITADGKVSYYEPPQPVLMFLNEPSISNAKAYVAWQRQKMERITKAQEILLQLQSENEP